MVQSREKGLTLAELREQLDRIDRGVFELVAKRRNLGGPIAEAKRRAAMPLRDFSREREVLLRARRFADTLDLPHSLADRLTELFILDSLAMQEQAQVAALGQGNGSAALIIGGAGKMGSWFAEFLASQGYNVTVADPHVFAIDSRHLNDWRLHDLDVDLIVVATSIESTNQVLIDLAARSPRGLVFDICSLKAPLQSGLSALLDAGCNVTSLHPMFGPSTGLLSGKQIIVVDLGIAAAVQQAKSLFDSTMVERITMTLDNHDRLIGYVLGLTHAMNIAFASVLARSGPTADHLVALSSTSFARQVEVAQDVTSEEPQFYFQIQSLNSYGLAPLLAIQDAIGEICRSIAERNGKSFEAMMEDGREFIARRSVDKMRVS